MWPPLEPFLYLEIQYVPDQFFVLFDELLIDDIKITGISNVITGINNEAQEEEKEILSS